MLKAENHFFKVYLGINSFLLKGVTNGESLPKSMIVFFFQPMRFQ